MNDNEIVLELTKLAIERGAIAENEHAGHNSPPIKFTEEIIRIYNEIINAD